MDFQGFNKIARLSRPCVITEKIDGTNAQITITEDGEFLIGSRKRYIVPGNDNFGFALWATENKDELLKLGVGTHFGEWWGKGIQRNYGLDHKVFSLFNVHKWGDPEVRPKCCSVVPTLGQGLFTTEFVDNCLGLLTSLGSSASPGFKDPEGIVIYHTHGGGLFKKTIKNDEVPKYLSERRT